jgi:hypothetical protein
MIGMGVSWRCYGRNTSFAGEIKRDICFRERPPRIAPIWCPHRTINVAHKEKEVTEQIEALRTESEARRELLMRMTDRCNGLLQQQEAIKREANQQVEALQAEIVSLKNDVNTLNDIVRFKTDMGQGEIDSLAVDIEAIKREAEQAGVRKVVEWIDEYKLFALVPNPQEYVINALDWQARLKEWGIEEK